MIIGKIRFLSAVEPAGELIEADLVRIADNLEYLVVGGWDKEGSIIFPA